MQSSRRISHLLFRQCAHLVQRHRVMRSSFLSVSSQLSSAPQTRFQSSSSAPPPSSPPSSSSSSSKQQQHRNRQQTSTHKKRTKHTPHSKPREDTVVQGCIRRLAFMRKHHRSPSTSRHTSFGKLYQVARDLERSTRIQWKEFTRQHELRSPSAHLTSPSPLDELHVHYYAFSSLAYVIEAKITSSREEGDRGKDDERLAHHMCALFRLLTYHYVRAHTFSLLPWNKPTSHLKLPHQQHLHCISEALGTVALAINSHTTQNPFSTLSASEVRYMLKAFERLASVEEELARRKEREQLKLPFRKTSTPEQASAEIDTPPAAHSELIRILYVHAQVATRHPATMREVIKDPDCLLDILQTANQYDYRHMRLRKKHRKVPPKVVMNMVRSLMKELAEEVDASNNTINNQHQHPLDRFSLVQLAEMLSAVYRTSVNNKSTEMLYACVIEYLHRNLRARVTSAAHDASNDGDEGQHCISGGDSGNGKESNEQIRRDIEALCTIINTISNMKYRCVGKTPNATISTSTSTNTNTSTSTNTNTNTNTSTNISTSTLLPSHLHDQHTTHADTDNTTNTINDNQYTDHTALLVDEMLSFCQPRLSLVSDSHLSFLLQALVKLNIETPTSRSFLESKALSEHVLGRLAAGSLMKEKSKLNSMATKRSSSVHNVHNPRDIALICWSLAYLQSAPSSSAASASSSASLFRACMLHAHTAISMDKWMGAPESALLQLHQANREYASTTNQHHQHQHQHQQPELQQYIIGGSSNSDSTRYGDGTVIDITSSDRQLFPYLVRRCAEHAEKVSSSFTHASFIQRDVCRVLDSLNIDTTVEELIPDSLYVVDAAACLPASKLHRVLKEGDCYSSSGDGSDRSVRELYGGGDEEMVKLAFEVDGPSHFVKFVPNYDAYSYPAETDANENKTRVPSDHSTGKKGSHVIADNSADINGIGHGNSNGDNDSGSGSDGVSSFSFSSEPEQGSAFASKFSLSALFPNKKKNTEKEGTEGVQQREIQTEGDGRKGSIIDESVSVSASASPSSPPASSSALPSIPRRTRSPPVPLVSPSVSFPPTLPTGNTLLKWRQLRKDGWRVISVLYTDWEDLGDDDRLRQQYLLHRIRQAMHE